EFSPPVDREADFDHSLFDVVAEEVCHLSRFFDTIQLGCGDTVDLCESLDYLSVVLAEAFSHRIQRCSRVVESHGIERVVSTYPVKSCVYIFYDSQRLLGILLRWSAASCKELSASTAASDYFGRSGDYLARVDASVHCLVASCDDYLDPVGDLDYDRDHILV